MAANNYFTFAARERIEVFFFDDLSSDDVRRAYDLARDSRRGFIRRGWVVREVAIFRRVRWSGPWQAGAVVGEVLSSEVE